MREDERKPRRMSGQMERRRGKRWSETDGGRRKKKGMDMKVAKVVWICALLERKQFFSFIVWFHFGSNDGTSVSITSYSVITRCD